MILYGLPLVLILTFLGNWCSAQQPAPDAPVSVRVEAKPIEISLGDRVEYRVDITHEKGIQLREKWPSGQLGDFEILDVSPTNETVGPDGKALLSKAFSLTTFATGELTIPPFEVSYSDASGKEDTVNSSSLAISVKSMIGSGTPELRDIKPPTSLTLRIGQWVYWTLGFFLLIILVFLLLVFWKKKETSAEAPPEPVIPADLWALSELRRVRLGPLLREHQSKALAIETSDIIRRYLERRFGMTAIDMTTEEIMEALKDTSIAFEINRSFGDLFSLCDLIKFAKYQPADEALIDILDQAETLVNQTRAKEVEAATEPEGLVTS